jgi:hypothetical protein
MKTYLKFIIIFIILLLLLLSCQQEKNIYGRWKISDIKAKDSTDNTSVALVGVIFAQSDFSYLEFTNENKLKYYNSENKIIAEEKYLFSKDGNELSTKGNENQVYSINILNDIEISLETSDVIITLEKLTLKNY